MVGILRIIVIGKTRDKHGREMPEYQLTYAAENGDTYSRTFAGDEELTTFLRTDVAVDEDTIARALSEAKQHGHATIPDVDLSEEELTPMGMVQVPSDI